MVSTKAQRRLGLYLACMVVAHVYLFYSAWSGVQRGFPDFTIFYTAAKILAQGRGPELYNDALQESVQRRFAPAVDERGSIVPFNHPPFEAIVFRPFAHLSYTNAYVVWLGINLGMLLACVLVLRGSLAAAGNAPLWLWMLAALGFSPVAMALLQGQDSIWVLLCYCLAFAAFRREAEFRSGVWLGLGLCKFHMVLPFMVGPFLQKRWRQVGGFLLTGATLVSVSLLAVGFGAILQYPRYTWWTDHVEKFRWNFLHSNTPNLRGMILSLLPPRLWPVGEMLVVLASLLVLSFAVYFWRRAGNSFNGRALAFAAAVVATVLVSYHTWVHDLTLLFLPILVLLDFQLQQPEMTRSQARLIQLMCAIFFCAPVFIYLIIRLEQLQAVTWLVLLLFFTIGSSIRTTADGPNQAASEAATRCRAICLVS